MTMNGNNNKFKSYLLNLSNLSTVFNSHVVITY